MTNANVSFFHNPWETAQVAVMRPVPFSPIRKVSSLSPKMGRGMGVLFFVVELQQKFFGREEGYSAELVEVLLVVRHYYVAAGG